MTVPRSVLVAAGGLLGSLARYWLSGFVQRLAEHEFPSGTLAVNIVGSFVIGLVMTLSLERGLIDEDMRLFLTTGFCGGFTTMSAFSYETMALLHDGEMMLALGNVGGSLVACLGAVRLGMLLGGLI